MPQTAFFGTVAAYVVLAVLLLNLNIFSLWKWWVKAAAILVTTACFVLAYFSIDGMIGWPSSDHLPKRFSVLATRIVEPSLVKRTPGHVYLWVEEIDTHQVPVGPPRGYELPYSPQFADQTYEAQKKINSGEKVMGQASISQEPPPNTEKGKGGSPARQQGRVGLGTKPAGETVAAESIGEAQSIVFSDMPPVDLPDKANEPNPPSG